MGGIRVSSGTIDHHLVGFSSHGLQGSKEEQGRARREKRRRRKEAEKEEEKRTGMEGWEIGGLTREKNGRPPCGSALSVGSPFVPRRTDSFDVS